MYHSRLIASLTYFTIVIASSVVAMGASTTAPSFTVSIDVTRFIYDPASRADITLTVSNMQEFSILAQPKMDEVIEHHAPLSLNNLTSIECNKINYR